MLNQGREKNEIKYSATAINWKKNEAINSLKEDQKEEKQEPKKTDVKKNRDNGQSKEIIRRWCVEYL